ncbi:MAG: molecular chaperone HtpG, partial [Sedimenticola sp.]|nr:molecular chaperone HtpG [Sedimenticola sp.]
EALTDDALYEEEPNLAIRVSFDKERKTVTIEDNGIGMSRQEVTETIGTIASSGTKKFLEALGNKGDDSAASQSQLIGQFGVGFYSAFIVADKVTLLTRRAGLGSEHGVCWESTGEGAYTIETVEKAGRGTSITLHLREDETEFLEGYRLRSIISKFSDHISIPIEMLKEVFSAEEDDKEEKEEKAPEWEQVNKGTALWMRNKSDIKDDEYNEFYKHIAHDFEDPLAHVHNRVEGTNEYSTLMYIPGRAPFDLWERDQKHGVKLYVRRVFIMDEADKLMPHYLRFVKGVVDSDDLPLNVSREILQHDKKIDTIRTASTKRILGLLEKMAKNDVEKYQKFWTEFGKVMKEGPAEDFANKEKIGGLLRFATTKSEGKEETVSLDQYIERMQEKQEKIYYITADSYAAARHSPHLEVFTTKDVEVLLLTDRVDEWLVSHLHDYKGKALQSVAKGQLDLGDMDDKEALEKEAEEHKGLLDRVKAVLGEDVKEVRVSSRLTESPACLIADEHDMGANLQRMLKQLGQDAPATKPIFELNLKHPLVEKMDQEQDEDRFADLSRVLLDQATLAEGGQLEDPAAFVHRLNKLMLSLSA